MKRALVLVAAMAALSACTPKPKVTVVKPSSQAVAIATLQRVNSAAYACWPKDKELKAYGIVPELDTTGTPRILLVPKGKPQALPKLVIAANGRQISTFGPLMEGTEAGRINADVARWAAGNPGCAA
jgi:hypothetical protein